MIALLGIFLIVGPLLILFLIALIISPFLPDNTNTNRINTPPTHNANPNYNPNNQGYNQPPVETKVYGGLDMDKFWKQEKEQQKLANTTTDWQYPNTSFWGGACDDKGNFKGGSDAGRPWWW
jgi:hypothetical protein